MKFFLPFLVLFLALPPPAMAARGQHAMAVTSDGRATAVALDVLQNGGNAVDAAIASQWVLNVVEPQSSGLGGGGFLLYYNAEMKAVYVLDGREKAPALASADLFLDEEGAPHPFRPARITGGLAVGVPGTLKLLHEAHQRFGSKRFSFGELFIPAIAMAEEGIEVSERLSKAIDQEKDRLQLFEASRRIFLDEKGEALKPGDRLVQRDLAETLRVLQRGGPPVFYEGEIAEDIVKAVREAPFRPGRLEKEDLFYYEVVEREAVHGQYRGYDILSVGPPSSGGTTLIEALQILERFELRLHKETADAFHLLAEAEKLAFQDRNRFVGDPDFVKVPLERLVSKKFALERSEAIDWEKAFPTPEAAVRPLHLEGVHTSHLSIVDTKGNMVAYTTTIEAPFGSALVVPGRGFLLNNELTDFDALPVDESGGKVPNAVEGGKRPRSSMAPTFVFHEGKPYLILGSPGGPAIIGIVLNVLVSMIDFGMTLREALEAPRMLAGTGSVELEPGLFGDSFLKRALEKKGHPVRQIEPVGNVQAIHFDSSGTQPEILGESDPRGEGEAVGF